MTISSSLAAGVAGLNANAQRLATISDNIANSGTYGYKRSFTDLYAQTVDTGSKNTYVAGGVRASTERLIEEKGQLQGTSNPTDIAVAGRGFLPVTTATATAVGEKPLSLMTTGSFRPDKDGILTDASGMVLMGWPANGDGSFANFPRDSISGLEPIRISHNQYTANPTTRVNLGVNLPAAETQPGGAMTPYDVSLEYFGNLGESESMNFMFVPQAQNVWRLQINDEASAVNPVAEYDLEFSDASVGGGTLASVTTVTGNAYDPATGTIEMNFDNADITLNIGKLADPGGMTQLDTTFAPSALSKNGSSVGNMLGVEITEGGLVTAKYDSGFTRAIYRVPLIDVSNPNGLQSGPGQTYTVTRESGGFFLWDAGTGPVGETAGYTREASTTDVAVELTQMIQTQRAYSSNAKVIQTVDEMLQETTNLKR